MFERNRIADTLRNAREKRGMTIEEAASAAGIPIQYLRLLEGEANVRVGVSDELYLIPFFRRYAQFMSIDAEELLPDFLGMVQQVPGEGSPQVRLDYRPRYAGWWKPLAVVTTIGIAVTLLLRQTRDRPSFEEAGTGELATPAATAEAPTTPRATEARLAEAAFATLPSVDADPATPDSSQSPTPQVDATPVGAHELTIDAKEDAWLALATDDQPAKQYLLRAGEARTWTATRFSLTVGNAGGIALSLDGRELPPIGKPGQVMRNLRFPATAPNPSPS